MSLRNTLSLLSLLTIFLPIRLDALEFSSVALSKDSYRAPDTVRVRFSLKNELTSPVNGISVVAVLRVAGGPEVARKALLGDGSVAGGTTREVGQVDLWSVPRGAFLGLYELEMTAKSDHLSSTISRHCVIYRQDVAVELL